MTDNIKSSHFQKTIKSFLHLLTADLYALFKERSTIITFIIVAAYSLVGVLTNYAMSSVIGLTSTDIGLESMQSTASLMTDIALIIPILVGVIATRDFKNGTIRNKIIIGKRRSFIFISRLLVSLLFGYLCYLIYFVLTGTANGIAFGFSPGGVTGAEVAETAVIFAIGLLHYTTIITFVVFIAFAFKKSLWTTLFSVGLLFSSIMIILPNILIMQLSGGAQNEAFIFFLSILPTYQSLVITDVFSLGGAMEVPDYTITALFLSNVIYIIGFSLLGILVIKKSNLK